MMGITGAFSSLGINEPTTSNPQRVKMSRNSSLPNLASGEKLTISSSFIRNNYCEDETSDQPIDFSKKYCETKINDKPSTFNKVVKSFNNTFTMYAETDLDQPTDYSLRYAEDDSDSDGCNKITKTTENVEFVQDTIKTYCTEDTPYETPFNFSTSTSMSDLRIDDKTSVENKIDSEQKHANITVINTKEKVVKSSFSSGLMSPEKPVNYCEEGTPGYFSRVASCGSLNSIPVSDQPKQELEEDSPKNKEPRRLNKFPTETTKAVKFEEVVNYAEETPLMFSRSSSLASLDSIEQHSIPDDRSSVISDFSRLTSGLISPSELPDSPSQTIPPSPKPRKNPLFFSQILKKKTDEPNVPKSSVFGDVVKKFKMESSPLQFSTATSLSSLTEDDIDGKNPQKNEEKNELSESSEDEDILAACINIGMQNNRYSQAKSTSPPPNEYKFAEISSPQHLSLKTSVEVVKKTDITSDSIRTYCTEDTPAILSQAGSNSDLSILSMHVESKIANNTGDNLSHGQQLKVVDDAEHCVQEVEKIVVDNLDGSLEAEKRSISRHSSFSSVSDESEEALLQECILAGMPKANSATNNICAEMSQTNVESSDDEEDTNILADCINSGMKNNRYSQVNYNILPNKNSKTEVITDQIKSYYTEGTPAGLSHAGSGSDLSILSAQANENAVAENDDLSDFASNFSDDEDEKLLMECVRYGMAKIAGSAAENNERQIDGRNYLQQKSPKRVAERGKVDLNISVEDNVSDEDNDHSLSSFTDDESEEGLLQECILAGMPKPRRPQADTLTAAEEALLQQCILEGMKKCRISKEPPPPSDTSDLTEAERALLRQCILAGMPKNKNLSVGGPSRTSSSSTSELTESERLLLQQCILAGMPKAKGGKSLGGRKVIKEERGEGMGHTCCIHCPKNNRGRGSHGRSRRRYREGRDILYVTSQILAMKKEILDRSNEEWV